MTTSNGISTHFDTGANASPFEIAYFSPTVSEYIANKASYDNLSEGFDIEDTAANIQANMVLLAGDNHIHQILVTSAAGPSLVTISTATFASAIDAVNKIVGGVIVMDTAANIEAHLTLLNTDAGQVSSINIDDNGGMVGPVTVTTAQFDTFETLLNKVSSPIVISDTSVNILADLVNLSTDQSHISYLLERNAPPVVGIGTFKSFKSLLNKFVFGFGIKDDAAAIQANFADLVSDIHIISITASDATLKFSASTFIADEAAINKVTGGVAIYDTTQDVAASASSLIADTGAIQSIHFTDIGTPVLNLTARQISQDKALLGNISGSYVLEDLTSPGHTTTTGHGDNLTISGMGPSDTITGGGTNEHFVLCNDLGHVTLVDFSKHLSGAGADSINLSGMDFGSFHLLTSKEASQHGSDVWLKSSNSSDTIVLDNMTLKGLAGASADFRFFYVA